MSEHEKTLGERLKEIEARIEKIESARRSKEECKKR